MAIVRGKPFLGAGKRSQVLLRTPPMPSLPRTDSLLASMPRLTRMPSHILDSVMPKGESNARAYWCGVVNRRNLP